MSEQEARFPTHQHTQVDPSATGNVMNGHPHAPQDPYLAGSIAARSGEWWNETTAEQEADFLRDEYDKLVEREHKRNEQLANEYVAMAKGDDKGDPAAREDERKKESESSVWQKNNGTRSHRTSLRAVLQKR